MWKLPSGKIMLMVLLCCDICVTEAKPSSVSEAEVANCRFIATVEGSSGYGKNPRWETIAQWYAGKEAERLGATHVVFTQMRPRGAFNGEADARAYTCQ